ncbi:MAG: ABC transporter substrate-binding protein [Lachnospiraceae bacterium]|nr:ABC transporter substrate-binding protein [Lachnospiraceae bacterium]
MKKNKIKKMLAVMNMAILTFSLMGCGEKEATGVTEKSSEAGTAVVESAPRKETVEESATVDAPVQTEPLVVYLNDFDGVIVDMFKEATGYDVEVVVGNGAETMSRIAAEKGNAQWDVVWIDSMYDVYMLQESNAYDMLASGEPISIIWPEAGAPGSTRVAAISASTNQLEIAKIFVNFLLEADTQQQLIDTGDEGYFEPSVEGVTLKAERAADAKLVVADVIFGAENEAEIKAWFADMSAQ